MTPSYKLAAELSLDEALPDFAAWSNSASVGGVSFSSVWHAGRKSEEDSRQMRATAHRRVGGISGITT